MGPTTENARPRLLLVHAHPDDESITTGATMAAAVASGARVTLVTCTQGEEGEIIPPALAPLAADRADRLGTYRSGELTVAMAALGVRDHRFLGGPGRYRDSGMMGAPQNERPGSFWSAPLDEAAGHLVAVIREVRPDVLVTYDPDGGYGHPDHIQAHRVATRAAELAADPGALPAAGPAHTIAKTYWNRLPRPVAEAAFEEAARALPASPFTRLAAVDDVPGVTEAARVTTAVDARAHLPAKLAAMRAHATQLTVAEPLFALSNDLAQPVFGVEYYELVRGEAGPPGPDGLEAGLFAGLGTHTPSPAREPQS
ncbi:N-acetyl-1-D-myo-inositol-2-amino-2-deoxy-alpha-D-glucopyranoside deacetylase [Streptomyces sp. SPB074]|uniref:N-acetyl-1-D-myo-inositol-2-amino-2-deoxy-alpha- D-glucopyranoside deacetylase n=1 Tax=Streptomyces sp. (strain SPB074) TaxID=465543 RepID=UPI000561BA9C|nr:N-acetyl-1-D-myo-inositol-2-amino-2-deoxy-alpha-D-glucopyranoside deacetylase [Streptomyces sp. SPB074]